MHIPNDPFLTYLVVIYCLTAEALVGQVSQKNIDKGLTYPPFTNVRKISHIVANVSAQVLTSSSMNHYPYADYIRTNKHMRHSTHLLCCSGMLFLVEIALHGELRPVLLFGKM
ncbi:hypothetical protein MKX03_003650 [Papaver bracteatum]|nr:hypothetical protein MKX03_003650 [Papaver bracteatum]